MDIGRLQPAIIIAAALIGIGLGSVVPMGDSSSWMIQLFLMLLLFVLFLSVDLRKMGRSLLNVRFTATALALNFVLTPMLSYILGLAFFSGSVDLRIGLIMLLVTPCTDWYLVFTGLSKGNVELGMSILPLNLVLQIVLLPVYLMLFVGSEVHMDAAAVVLDMAQILVVPFVLSVVVKALVGGRESFGGFMSSHGDDLQLLFLCLAVVVMFASESVTLFGNPLLLVEMFVPLLIFFALLLLVSQGVGRLEGFPYEDRVSLTFTSMARNSPLSLAIAVVTFPDMPLVSLALVIGPLIELPILTLTSWHLLRRRGREAETAMVGRSVRDWFPIGSEPLKFR